MTIPREVEETLRDVAYKWYTENQHLLPNRDECSRNIVVTPFDGHYGQLGYVIAINGSPPHGVFFVFSRDHTRDTNRRIIIDCVYVIKSYPTRHSVVQSTETGGWRKVSKAKLDLLNALADYITEWERDRGLIAA